MKSKSWVSWERSSTTSGYLVTPIVGLINAVLHFIRQEDEVEDIFQAPLSLVLEHSVYKKVKS